MSGGGSGSTTQTVNSGPPQQFIDAYTNVNNRAQQVAQTPYQPYPGQTVAGLSPDQQAGISTIQSANGIAQPYINTASQFINNSTKPLWDSTQQFSPEAVAKYQSPYTKNVVDTTRQLFNEQNQEQQQGVVGDAISRGAWGGDRSAVAQGILARNQQLAQAPVLAGLENQGYSQALQEFNQQQGAQLGANQANAWLNSQAGAGYANLGNQALQSTLAGGNALLGVGNLEQAQAQAELNVPYQQWQAAQAYPFQTTSWLANIAEGLGGASGGTSSTTSPGPNVGSQIAGAGIAGVGALGQSGAFGSNGWLSSAFGSGGGATDISSELYGGLTALGYDRGGGIVPRRAPGGIAGEPPFGTHIPDLELSIIPGADGLSVNPGHSGANLLSQNTGSTTTGQGPDTTGQQVGQAIGAIASIAALAFSDRRLKEDVAHVGWLKDGTPVHRYRYKGNPQWHIGVIAQEAEKNHPDAVHETQHGIKMVDNKALTDESAGRGIVAFPHHRARTGRGILAANDDIGNQAEPRRAAGGGIAGHYADGGVNVMVVPGSYEGSPGVPMLTGGGGGGAAPSGGGGISPVMDYLNAQKGGGFFGKPDSFDVSTPMQSSQPMSDKDVLGRVFARMWGYNSWPTQSRAGGGALTVTMTPGSYKGSPDVPILGGGPNAGIISPSTGLGAVNDYFAASKAGAHFGLPQTYVPPPIMQAMGVPSASGDGGGGGGGWSAPAGGGLEGGGGGAAGEGGGGGTAGGGSQGGVGGNDIGGGAGAGADYGGSGAGDQGSNDSGGDAGGEGSDGSESARGGIVARRDDGGVLDLDLSGGGDPWQSDAPARGASAGDLPSLNDYAPGTPVEAALPVPQNTQSRKGIAGAPMLGAGDYLKRVVDAIRGQEGSGPQSVSKRGAHGSMQVTQPFFQTYAKPDEKFDREEDRTATAERGINSLLGKYRDPARVAVAYFSGPGNVAPPDSPVPWIENKNDGGTTVSQYVDGFLRRLGSGGTQYAKADTGTMTDASDAAAGPSLMATDAEPVDQGITNGEAAPSGTSSPWSALTYAGLGILGGASPNAGVNIGRGALAGLHQYDAEKSRSQQAAALDAWRRDQADISRQRLAENITAGKENRRTTRERLDAQEKWRQQQLDQGRYTWSAGMGPSPDDPSKQVSGSYRYPTRGDEQPKFFPGVVQTPKGGEGSKLSEDTITALAERLIAGDQGAISGLGYGNVGAANRAAVQEKVTTMLRSKGLTGADLAAATAGYMGERAGARTAGTREANVSMAINEAKTFMPLALDASNKVTRTNFPTLNSIMQAVEKGTGDENVVRLAVATNSLTNAYSRAVSPGGVPTEGYQQRAMELLDKAWSQGQYHAAVDQLMKEMNAAQLSPIQTREEQRQRISGRGAEAPKENDKGAAPSATTIPAEAASKLKEGQITTFRNGQKWTLKNGKPQQVEQ